MPNAPPRDIVLLLPAQSKWPWTFHKSHFVWKFTGIIPDASDTTSIEHRALTVAVMDTLFGEKHADSQGL